MAVAHISFNDQLTHGRMIRRALQSLEEGTDTLNDLMGVLATMIDGDGSQAAHFTYMTTKCGFASDAGAKAGYDELASLKFKLSTDTSQTDVNAALIQAFRKFG
jgi:hypothetical protein